MIDDEKIVRDMLDGNLAEYVKKNIDPPLGGEGLDPVLRKYGATYTGICDGWSWYTTEKIVNPGPNGEERHYNGTLCEINDNIRAYGKAPIEEASEAELWKIIAICNTYWYNSYKRWYNDAEERTRKILYEQSEGE